VFGAFAHHSRGFPNHVFPPKQVFGVHPLSSFGSPSETLAPVAPEPKFEMPPVGFCAPTASPRSLSRLCCSGPTRNAVPPWSFSDLRGFDPHRAWWPCFMPHPLLGFRSSRLFPSTDSIGFVTRWYPLDVPRRCLPLLANQSRPSSASRPQGFSSRESPLPMQGVFHLHSGPMPSRAFTSTSAVLRPSGLETSCIICTPTSRSLFRCCTPAHPLVTFLPRIFRR